MPSIAKKTVMPKRISSKVWQFFVDNKDGEYASCLLCKYHPTNGVAVSIKVGGGSTQSLRNHIRSHHKKEFSDMEKAEKEEKEESEAKKTKTQNLGIKPDSTPKIGDLCQFYHLFISE